MVEDDQVKTAMENFAGSLTRFKEAWFTPFDPQADRPNQDQLGILRHGQKDMKDRAYQLAKALQASIITGWAVPLKE